MSAGLRSQAARAYPSAMPEAKHWIDPDLLAPNVREVEIGERVIARLEPFVTELQAGATELGDITLQGLRFFHRGKSQWRSDIGWISAGDERCHAFFEGLFAESGLAERMAPHIAHDREIRLYSGFFVTRSQCSDADFHVDWIGGNNQAFTFLGAASANAGEIPLSYLTVRSEVREYAYPAGKGLVFGDHFQHSTGRGQADVPTVLLCFNFGTDRMADWAPLARTCARQSRLHRRPDGAFVERAPGA